MSAVISISLTELFTTLSEKGLVDPKSEVFHITIPPKFMLMYRVAPPITKIYIPLEISLWFDQDNALSCQFWIDSRLIHQDASMIYDLYRNPIDLLEIGGLVPIHKELTTILLNHSDTNVNLACWVKYISVERSVYESIIKKYFETILDFMHDRENMSKLWSENKNRS